MEYKLSKEYQYLKDTNKSLAVMKIENEKVSFEKYLNCEEDTLFNIGSVTKTIVGVIIFNLEKTSAISLDDYVSKYVPDIPYSNLKIKHLLYHESGVINYYRLFNDTEITTVDNKAALSKVFEEELNFIPGTKFEYSNTNYILLYEIIQNVTSETLEDTIFEILDSEKVGCMVYDSHDKKYENLVYSYNEETIDLHDSLTIGDGGLLCSIGFFKKFIKWFHKYISKAYYKTHRSYLTHEIDEHYEYGMTLEPLREKAYHFGMYMSYRSAFYTDYRSSETVIILSNSNHCTYEFRKLILSTLYDEQ